MIRAFIFLLKIGVLAALAVWLADRPGTVTFEWLDNKITMHIGAFLVCAMLVIVFALFLFRVIKGVADFPKTYKKYKEMRAQEKGYRALTLGLTAVAAGDTKNAVYQSYRASKLLPDDQGLPLLLQAQAARLKGDDAQATQSFIHLLESKDAAFFGIRGLLQTALDLQDYERALLLAEKALKHHPKQPWILKITYDLQIRQRHFKDAIKTLYRAEKAGAIPKDKANSDRVAILLYQAEEAEKNGANIEAAEHLEKAYKYDQHFIPTVLRLARNNLKRGRRRKAVAMIEKAWKINTHPDLVKLWQDAMPTKSKGKSPQILKWFERLLALNPGSAEAQMAVAQASIDHGLWGEARNYLKMAESIRQSARLYKLYAELEEKSTRDEIAIKHWLEKATDAPADRCWACMETGRAYPEWSPVAAPHGSFNTIRWDFPASNDNSDAVKVLLDTKTSNVLEAPKT